MSSNYLYSVVLELRATKNAILPATTGHQAHALFLDLVRQFDPTLASRLHDEPNYRPFTVSPLYGAEERNNTLILIEGHNYSLRLTFLDDGQLWQCLSDLALKPGEIVLHLVSANFLLQRVISTPSMDTTGWAGCTDWQTLANTKASRFITIRFASPTAFSLGHRRFALFPEPLRLWDSLLRAWNLYAPEPLQVEKSGLRDFVTQHVIISDYALYTSILHFPKHTQKGFQGTCTYLVKTESEHATKLAALARFSQYAGVGSKTTMGMGQARIEDPHDQAK